jgi:hypothetical protein
MEHRLYKNIWKGGEKMKRKSFLLSLLILALSLILLLSTISSVIATPDGIASSGVTVDANVTRSSVGAYNLNISGGRIAIINITGTTVDSKWKGFVGHVTGKFTLDDATGSTLYDWTLGVAGGEVYATRNSSSVSWSNIKCANTSLLEFENNAMAHTNLYDNITRTFNGTTHNQFYVGEVNISINSCPTLNTYNKTGAQDDHFQEMALTDSTDFSVGGKLIYSSIIEHASVGFDNNPYDFQMIVPERGSNGFSGQTAYYLYVELS